MVSKYKSSDSAKSRSLQRAQQSCHGGADYATRLKKQSEGLIVFRPNKRDSKVFVEAEQVDGREARKALGGIPSAPLRYS